MEEPQLNTFVVENDTPCILCGYNLRGLPLHGICPECGGNIANSRQGDLLRFANPQWVRRTYRGAGLIGAAFTLFFGVYIFGSFAFVAMQFAKLNRNTVMNASELVLFIVAIVSVAMLLTGVFLITCQEPRELLVEDPATSRRIARTAIVIGAPMFCFRYYILPTYPSFVFGNFTNIAFVISIAMSMKHAQLIIQRIPDSRLSNLLRKWRRMLLTSGLSFSGLSFLFGTVTAFRTKWSTVTDVTTAVMLVGYAFFAIVSVGLFIGVASALKDVQRAPRQDSK